MGLHSSARYLGAMPCKDLYTVTQILYNKRRGRSNQWRSSFRSGRRPILLYPLLARETFLPALEFVLTIAKKWTITGKNGARNRRADPAEVNACIFQLPSCLSSACFLINPMSKILPQLYSGLLA